MGKTLKEYNEWRLNKSLIDHSFYVKKYKRLLENMFEWSGLPSGISERFVEQNLFGLGMLVFHYDSKMGFYKMSKAAAKGHNAYDEPTYYQVYDVTGYSKMIKASECVPLWNNMDREGDRMSVEFFAQRISNIEKTIDVNLMQLRHPVVVACPEGQIASAESFFSKLSNGNPFLAVSDTFFDQNNWKAFDLKTQNHVQVLQEVKRDYENECLTYFGINNVDVFKKERLVTGEAEGNNEQIALAKNVRYKTRKMFCEQVKEKFGLDIDVKLSDTFMNEVESILQERGKENE